MRLAFAHLLKTFRDYELRSTGKWFALSGLIGLVSGLGAIGFVWLGQLIQYATLGTMAGWSTGEAAGEPVWFPEQETALSPWMLIPVLALGGLASGLLVYWFAPEAEGHGTDAAIDAFHNKQGRIAIRVPFVKTIASAITLGTGGSAGREGPIAQIGAGFGSILASWLKLSARDRRILLAAGMGAGVGAIFRAPLAGALFAGEILYRDADLEADAIVPAAISSTVGYSVYCLALPDSMRFSPLFGAGIEFGVASLFELLPYTLLALVLVASGAVYIKTFYGFQTLFQKLPVIPHLKPMIGATLAGLLGVSLYYLFRQDVNALSVLGSGYGTLQACFERLGSLSLVLLLAIVVGKILTTALTIGSGGSGGVFGPSIVIGGCLGAAVGQALDQWTPALISQPESFAIVGMAGFFAGSARAPFSTILMVTEMTGDYRLLLPTLWVSTLCFLLGRPWTLYQKQVMSRLDSPAHRGDFVVDVLEGMLVADVYQPHRKWMFIREATSLDEIVHLLAKTSQRYFPVVDDQQRLVGIFSSDDVRAYLYDDTIWKIANARDVMNSRVVTVTPEDDLNTALTSFTALNVDELPVVDPDEPTHLIGVIRRKETIAAYHRRRIEHVKAAEKQNN